jgi:uncharacterized protein YcbK (DUF882 family)
MMPKQEMKHFSGRTKRFVWASLPAFFAAFFLCPSLIAGSKDLSADRTLALYNIHSRESAVIEYCSAGVYVPDALTAVNRIMRDPLNGEVISIDPKLLDVLFELHEKIGAAEPFTVICGYRSPRTNSTLRARSSGVAEHSLHMQGKAVDIRLSGVPLEKLYRAALELKAGGVGFYPKSDFIHVDVGPVRTW